MSIRLASVLLSLLAHGTAFFYFGGLISHDRPVPSVVGKNLQVALVRADHKASSEPPALPAPQEKIVPPPAEVAPHLKAEPIASSRRVDRQPVATPVLAREVPTTAGMLVSPPPEAESRKHHQPPQKRTEPPLPKQITAEVQPVDTPAESPMVSVMPREIGPPPAAGAASEPSPDALRAIELSYMNALVAAIERHKRYPLRARKKGYEGEVQVQFTVLRDGTIARIGIGSSSLREILDQAASRAVRDLGRFAPIPPELGRDRWEFQVPVRFAMN